ncbi:nucleotide exchange factor GrpE [Chromatocurvus halotolerans]|uniref:Protein GrpE n=1 Tax=Chromatocurvus halotolerans TaxID=1132028 RepID=A0A4R2KC73_9GAMM|nr:nucleotide exchange factor GrpE [Chromatocurvus halotolerans]TCO71083.1 molecular chaperone GrpE [Chromatocurvus halotolerans]
MSDKEQQSGKPEEQPRADEAQAAEQQPEARAEDTQAAAAREQEGSEAGSSDADDPSPEDEIARLQEELEQARDSALRAQAEAQNAKRRAEQDVERARKYALERFAGELLPVVDNLERALESASGDEEVVKPIAEGVELTLKSFQNALQKYHIEAVDPQGEPFDPQLHQAMSQVENPDVEPNTVIAVMQKGYTLNGRLVRPAMVMVSKQAPGAPGASGSIDEHA